MSTIQEINDTLDANACWFTENSVVKCANWINAATQLLHRPEESKRNGQGTGASIRVNLEQIREELKTARKWYARNANRTCGGSITGVDFTYTDTRQ